MYNMSVSSTDDGHLYPEILLATEVKILYKNETEFSHISKDAFQSSSYIFSSSFCSFSLVKTYKIVMTGKRIQDLWKQG